MEIGDKIMFVPYCNRAGVTGEIKSKPVPGRVVWIHPELRFAVVERRTKKLYIPGEHMAHPGRKKDDAE